MKTKILLTALLSFSISFLFAQGINVSGTISCTEGLSVDENGNPFVIYYEGSNGFLNDSIFVPVNPDGSFTLTTEPNASQGSIYIYYFDAAGNQQVAVAVYSPESMNLVFTIDGCVEEPTCDASFSIYTDPIDPNSGNIYVVSNSTGDNLTYFWNFGDGSMSSDFSTSHYYPEMGTYTLCLTIVASDGCTDEYCDEFTMWGDSTFENGPGMVLQGFTMLVNMVQSVSEISSNDFQLFPNPVSASSPISIVFENNFIGQMSIVDMNGKLTNSFRLNAQKGITQIPANMCELTPGIYQVVMKSDNGVVSIKRFTRQ